MKLILEKNQIGRIIKYAGTKLRNTKRTKLNYMLFPFDKLRINNNNITQYPSYIYIN